MGVEAEIRDRDLGRCPQRGRRRDEGWRGTLGGVYEPLKCFIQPAVMPRVCGSLYL